MAFFFAKKPASVQQELRATGLIGGPPGAVADMKAQRADDAFVVELLGHLDTLYGVASRMTKGATEAEDLVQDTVVKAMRAQSQFQPGTNLRPGSFASSPTPSSTATAAAGSSATSSRAPTPTR
jgi:RNA polymerase sigma-70 factor (ECF subfamily)